MPKRTRHRFCLLLCLLLPTLLAFGGPAVRRGRLLARLLGRVAGLVVKRQAAAVPWQPEQPVPGTAALPVNLLVMGLQIGGASTNPLTDAMLVLSYDPKRNSASLLSIPRDLWVEIPGHGEGRINEAFQDGGPAEAMLTVHKALGIPVNYYALVDYAAFERLVDDVGGVTVDVPYDMDDPDFPAADEIHTEPFHIRKGVHRLSGHEALRYVRERHADPRGDIGRAQRQQQVLLALRGELLRPGNLFKLHVVLRDLAALVRTNFPLDQAADLVLQAMHAAPLRRGVLGYENGAVKDHVTGGGAAVLLPDPAVVQGIVRDLFAPTLAYLQAGARVRVDNGSGLPAAAAEYSQVLAAMGVRVLPAGEADRPHLRARVQAYTRDPARLDEARLLAGMLAVPLELSEGGETADVVITLGQDYAPSVPWSEADWLAALRPPAP